MMIEWMIGDTAIIALILSSIAAASTLAACPIIFVYHMLWGN